MLEPTLVPHVMNWTNTREVQTRVPGCPQPAQADFQGAGHRALLSISMNTRCAQPFAGRVFAPCIFQYWYVQTSLGGNAKILRSKTATDATRLMTPDTVRYARLTLLTSWCITRSFAPQTEDKSAPTGVLPRERRKPHQMIRLRSKVSIAAPKRPSTPSVCSSSCGTSFVGDGQEETQQTSRKSVACGSEDKEHEKHQWDKRKNTINMEQNLQQKQRQEQC